MNTHPDTESSAHPTRTVERLQDCLRSELSAMETYGLALQKVTHVGIVAVLQQIHKSHARRAESIDRYLLRIGAESPSSSGVWGALARAMQAGADLFGDRVAIAALEEGEDHGLKLYLDAAPQCDSAARRFIEVELLPEQQRTRDLCSTLKYYAKTPS
jgi:hypothetical protein